MSHARRIELGILTLAYMKEYVAKWTLANTSATEVEQKAAYKAELSAYCVSQGHGQKGVPSDLAEHNIYCTLHASCRLAPKQAFAVAEILPDIKEKMIEALTNYPNLESLCEAIRSESKDVNLTGNHAREFFANAAEIITPAVDAAPIESIAALKLLTHAMIIFLCRNILYSVISTHEHSDITVKTLSEQGMMLSNLHLEILGSENMQPYLYAIAVELPRQIAELEKLCRAMLGYGLDTTTLSAQDSEHINKVCKEIEQCMSDHKTIKSGSTNIEDYFRDRCFRVFTYETVVKDWAVREKITKHEAVLTRASKILKENDGCEWCGLSQRAHCHL